MLTINLNFFVRKRTRRRSAQVVFNLFSNLGCNFSLQKYLEHDGQDECGVNEVGLCPSKLWKTSEISIFLFPKGKGLDLSAILHENDFMFSIMMMQATAMWNAAIDRCR